VAIELQQDNITLRFGKSCWFCSTWFRIYDQS